jgi:hypothetical protein
LGTLTNTHSAGRPAHHATGDSIVTQRKDDIDTIRQLYGTDSSIGREMLMQILAKYALDMLPDAAISELAQMHRDFDQHGI